MVIPPRAAAELWSARFSQGQGKDRIPHLFTSLFPRFGSSNASEIYRFV